jgi:parallel beta-helix repeat protein
LIHPYIIGQLSKAKASSTEQIGSADNPYAFLEIAMRSISRFSVLFFTVGIVVASTGLFGTSQETAIAQIPGASNQMSPGVKTMSQVNVLFVNPSAADDNAANGSERAPFKTITKALRGAKPNTVIMLNRGTYSVESGEQFPLILKPGVSLQGDARTKGRGIIIQGGDDYLSRSYGGQNVTIVAGNQTGLTGMTVTNPNPRGYGVWIESSNPVIVENTFANSTQDGISVNGNSEPTIRNNYFFGNKANGITISGNSRPEVRENIFQQTGFGINITQNAQPIVVGNQIQYNRSGIVVQGNARPVLRNNIIQNNKEDGLVAIASSMPDLGSASEPGGNEFRNNTRFDINAGAAKQVISGAGNTLVGNRISGKVDMNATTASVTQSPQSLPLRTNTNQGLKASTEVTFSAPGVSETNNRLYAPLPRNNTPSGQLNPQLLPLQPANSSLPLGQFQQPFPGRSNPRPTPPAIPQTGQTVSRRNGGFPKPSSLPGYSNPGTQNAANSRDTPQINYVRIDPNTVEFTAPQSPSNLAAQSGQNMPPLGNSSLLPVPDRNVPIGNSGNSRNMRRMQIPESIPTTAYRQNPSFTPVAQPQPLTNSRFRVMVEVVSERDQELVKFLSPGAFSTIWQGKTVMQAGVFSSRYNADGMAKILYNNGLRAVVEEIS